MAQIQVHSRVQTRTRGELVTSWTEFDVVEGRTRVLRTFRPTNTDIDNGVAELLAEHLGRSAEEFAETLRHLRRTLRTAAGYPNVPRLLRAFLIDRGGEDGLPRHQVEPAALGILWIVAIVAALLGGAVGESPNLVLIAFLALLLLIAAPFVTIHAKRIDTQVGRIYRDIGAIVIAPPEYSLVAGPTSGPYAVTVRLHIHPDRGDVLPYALIVSRDGVIKVFRGTISGPREALDSASRFREEMRMLERSAARVRPASNSSTYRKPR